MRFRSPSPSFWFALLLSFSSLSLMGADAPKPGTMAEILSRSKASDWRTLDPENTVYVELPAGRVVIELAPRYAPNHVANVKALIREHYFDGLAVVRAQDNYVVQLADPNAEKPDLARLIRQGKKTLPAEFDRPIDKSMPFTPAPDGDVYAREVGFTDGFPVARDRKSGRTWLVHTYGMVGAGRDNSPDSGGGAEIYVVIGQAPRHLDRNVTLFGRVVEGMELLSVMARGPAPMGFYDQESQRVPIREIRLASDVPPAQRTALELLRTDVPLFREVIESKRNRREEWFVKPAGRIELSNIPLPIRSAGR